MSEKVGIECIVTGRVQGVWFRASTQDKARELDVTGWVGNLADGSVKVLAFGSKKQVDDLVAWLHQGPKNAKVGKVICKAIDYQEFERFAIK